MLTITIIAAVVLLAFANGANDNFKGVATLYGSGTTSYRRALAWATATTFAGSVVALWLAGSLLARFSGKGLVPDATVADPRFAATVALAAGATVLLATRLGFPVSTTHALVGAMTGAAFASASELRGTTLATMFFAPLLVSPVVAIVASSSMYPILRTIRCRLGIESRSCVCVGTEFMAVPIPSAAMATVSVPAATTIAVEVGDSTSCRQRYHGRVLGIEAAPTLDVLHFLSAGLVSFARGLNDTPKIAAVLLLVPSIGTAGSMFLCGTLIAIGGIVAARRVAESMSHRITSMNPGQGFTANLLTGILVIVASRWGLPVSTTHVSCGSLFGIGLVNGQAHWRFIFQVLLAWLTTLPLAAAIAWLIFRSAF
jgi:inorganic phosphate transporter, PiT family